MQRNLFFLVILGFIVLRTICYNKKTYEPMTNESLALAIQNLSDVATKLQTGGLTVGGGLTCNLLTTSSMITNNETDWLRIGCDWAVTKKMNYGAGRTAIYGGVCIADTGTKTSGGKFGGLNVGEWNCDSTYVGAGNIRAVGTIRAGTSIIVGGEVFIDHEGHECHFFNHEGIAGIWYHKSGENPKVIKFDGGTEGGVDQGFSYGTEINALKAQVKELQSKVIILQAVTQNMSDTQTTYTTFKGDIKLANSSLYISNGRVYFDESSIFNQNKNLMWDMVGDKRAIAFNLTNTAIK